MAQVAGEGDRSQRDAPGDYAPQTHLIGGTADHDNDRRREVQAAIPKTGNRSADAAAELTMLVSAGCCLTDLRH